jgi:hypothetical protein
MFRFLIANKPACLLVTGLVAAGMLSNCGKKSSDPKKNVDPQVVTSQLRLGVAASNYQQASAAFNLNAGDQGDVGNPPFKATSIFSGSPESFSVLVKKIELRGTSDTGPLSVKVFEDAGGKAISIEGSNVDLTDLFSTPTCLKPDGEPYTLKEGEKCECGIDAAGNLVKKTSVKNEETGADEMKCNYGDVEVPPVGVVDVTTGTFTTLAVTYSKKATIKGCVGGFYRANATGVGDTAVAHKYCTRADGGLFTGGQDVTLATFEDKEPQEMDTPLTGVGGPNAFTADVGDLEVTYPIDPGLKIEAGKSSALTLIIDTNRMLRFEAANRDDATVLKTGWPKSRPYFFSTIFEASSFVYVGEPGSIRGYDWGAYVCRPSAIPCKGTSDVFYIQGWLTSILNKDGTPAIMTYMPDDDSTLTVIKGNNLIRSNSGTAVTTTVDPDGFVKAADGKLSLKYRLDDKTGTIALPSEPTELGIKVEGSFEGFGGSGGEFTLTRRL